jgi:hypothetical protein
MGHNAGYWTRLRLKSLLFAAGLVVGISLVWRYASRRILSITEVLPDPHYQSRSVVRRLGEAAGFTVETVQGSARAFTMNLRKR